MKRYITYKRVKVSPVKYIDPNTDGIFAEATSNSTFFETPYQLEDGRFIAYVEYPDDTPQEKIDELIAGYSLFEFTFITEEEANLLLSELGDISVKDFVFTDNRKIDLI